MLTLFRHVACGTAALFIFYLSLVATSQPLTAEKLQPIDRAVDLLDEKGFRTEAFLLRNAATIRTGENWLNELFAGESSFASTNFPFGIITVTPDFFEKTHDDLERAMILLHEAQHLQGRNDPYAYAYIWKHRQQLGWTQLKYGTSETYVSVELQTREYAPELFTCSANVWHDCTETLRARR